MNTHQYVCSRGLAENKTIVKSGRPTLLLSASPPRQSPTIRFTRSPRRCGVLGICAAFGSTRSACCALHRALRVYEYCDIWSTGFAKAHARAYRRSVAVAVQRTTIPIDINYWDGRDGPIDGIAALFTCEKVIIQEGIKGFLCLDGCNDKPLVTSYGSVPTPPPRSPPFRAWHAVYFLDPCFPPPPSFWTTQSSIRWKRVHSGGWVAAVLDRAGLGGRVRPRRARTARRTGSSHGERNMDWGDRVRHASQVAC